MPTRFIQRKPRPLLSVRNGQTTAIGIDSDSDELKWLGASDMVIVAPATLPIRINLDANSVDMPVFTADANYQLTAVNVVASTAGVAGSTVQIRKCTSTVAPAAGTALLTSAVTLAGTANFVFSGTLSSTTADLQLAAGDRLSADLTGTLTNLVAVVSVFLKRIE